MYGIVQSRVKKVRKTQSSNLGQGHHVGQMLFVDRTFSQVSVLLVILSSQTTAVAKSLCARISNEDLTI